MRNLLCQSAPLNIESEIQTGIVVDWPQAAVATWPPHAVASLAPLPAVDRKRPHPSALPLALIRSLPLARV